MYFNIFCLSPIKYFCVLAYFNGVLQATAMTARKTMMKRELTAEEAVVHVQVWFIYRLAMDSRTY